MVTNAPVMDRSDVTAPPQQGAGACACDLRADLLAAVELHSIRLKGLAHLWIWDVQKRRAVTVACLAGRHAVDAHQLNGCARCVAIEKTLRDLVSYALSPQGDRCQHLTGAARVENVNDDLSGPVHQVTLPLVLIHRTASRADDSPGSKCVAEFRFHLEQLGLSELAECAELDPRRNQ